MSPQVDTDTNKFTIRTCRYEYINPKGNFRCDFLESTEDVRGQIEFLAQLRELAGKSQTLPPFEPRGIRQTVLARENGGQYDNNVQMVLFESIKPAEPFNGISLAHGVINHPSDGHSVGDPIFVRSDLIVFYLYGQKVPILNLRTGKDDVICARDVDWLPMKREQLSGSSSRAVTIVSGELGPYYPDDVPHRMVIVVDEAKAFHTPLPTVASTGIDPGDQYALALLNRAREEMDTGIHMANKMYVSDLDKSYEDVVGGLDVNIRRYGTSMGTSHQGISGRQVSKRGHMMMIFC